MVDVGDGVAVIIGVAVVVNVNIGVVVVGVVIVVGSGVIIGIGIPEKNQFIFPMLCKFSVFSDINIVLLWSNHP